MYDRCEKYNKNKHGLDYCYRCLIKPIKEMFDSVLSFDNERHVYACKCNDKWKHQCMCFADCCESQFDVLYCNLLFPEHYLGYSVTLEQLFFQRLYHLQCGTCFPEKEKLDCTSCNQRFVPLKDEQECIVCIFLDGRMLQKRIRYNRLQAYQQGLIHEQMKEEKSQFPELSNKKKKKIEKRKTTSGVVDYKKLLKN